jgi:phosphodiesterase/alkaline phosphatase D-like protein
VIFSLLLINALLLQLAWLERVLAQSKADWLVVVCHFPIMSAAEYAG